MYGLFANYSTRFQSFLHHRTIRQNLYDLVKEDQVGAGQIASAVIKTKSLPPRENYLLSQAKGGRSFPVTPGNYTFFVILKYLKYNQQY